MDLVNNILRKGPKFLYYYFKESSYDRKNVDFVNLEDSLLTQYNDEVKNICSVNMRNCYYVDKIYQTLFCDSVGIKICL